jgi:imidazolonepropionase-like amidohydrolase
VASVLIAAAVAASRGAAAADGFVRPMGRIVALTHVTLIDGSGDRAKADQTIVLDGGRIAAIGDASGVRIPENAQTLDLRGRTVFPGLVGMHDHLFYTIEPGGDAVTVLAQSTFAKLYLAAGVTTIRTAGTADFEGDARLKQRIDAGAEPGPKIHLSGPYLAAAGTTPNPGGIAGVVAAFADKGATSFKAYTTIRRSELKAAIDAAHARGLTVTGHLCAVGYREAAAMGIDNLEHGLAVDAEFVPRKQPDECPNQWDVFDSIIRRNTGDAEIQQLIETLVRRGVTITSTLSVFESYAVDESMIDPRTAPILSSRLLTTFQQARDRRKDPKLAARNWWSAVLRKEMAFERAFVRAGGRLLAGSDPTGWGAVLAGYGDQRGLELLVTAGFTPEQAIRIATSNGARFLNDETVGRIAEGRQADLVVVTGDVSRDISNVRNVELVFKDGAAYDPGALIAAATGTLDVSQTETTLRWSIAAVLALLVGRRFTRMKGVAPRVATTI